MSQSKTKLNSVMKMETVNGKKVPSKSEIQKQIKEVTKEIEKTKGISQVKTKLDFTNYIASLSLNFKQVENLNQVLQTFQNKGWITKEFNQDFYSYNKAKKKFSKKNKIDLKEKYSRIKTADKKILSNATYTSIMQFAEPIVWQSNPNAKTSKSKKASMFNALILEIIKQKKTVNNVVILTK